MNYRGACPRSLLSWMPENTQHKGAGPFSITDTATGSIGTSPYQLRRAP